MTLLAGPKDRNPARQPCVLGPEARRRRPRVAKSVAARWPVETPCGSGRGGILEGGRGFSCKDARARRGLSQVWFGVEVWRIFENLKPDE